MKIWILRSFVLCFFLLKGSFSGYAQFSPASRNDHIFPPSAHAKPFIDYDSRGFIINGKRVFIASAGIEYARVPRALWRDRLLRLKRGGYNTVEFYTFWNFHEPQEGRFNFAGDHDLDAFLKLVKQMGMYAIARVGPYYCGEWNMGGYPIWLKFKPGLRVRENNPQFLTAVDHFFNRLIPIITKNQIDQGGAVIMVQLENEHRAAWGTVTPNGYFRHLINKTVSLGLSVPCFFSGLHPGNDPAGDVVNLDDPKRPNPWFSTEYWGVWFLNYGPQPQDSAKYDRRTWKIIAHGGNGYNVYMAHGGTNFDYNNDRDMAASYDYGASIGQAGDLRPLYYSFKRANWFARSFGDILANSKENNDDKPMVSDTAVHVNLRQSPAGTIAFLDNTDSNSVQLKLNPPAKLKIHSAASIDLAAGEIMPVVYNYQLTPAVKIAWAPTRIYAVIPQGKTTTVLLYGAANSDALLYFDIAANRKLTTGACFEISGNKLAFKTKISAHKPLSYSFEADGRSIQIIVMDNMLAAHCWIIELAGKTNIVTGPAYVADILYKPNELSIITESPWGTIMQPAWLFQENAKSVKSAPQKQVFKHITYLKPVAWQTKDAAPYAMPAFDDSKWKQSNTPLQMGADGDITANAWYRTKIKVQQTGYYHIQFKNLRDRAEMFLDGKRIDTGEIVNKKVKVYLKGGKKQTLAIFTAHDGRNKLIFRVGEIDTVDAKGITGPVTVQKADGMGKELSLNNWRMKGGPGAPFKPSGWQLLRNVKNPGPRYYRAVFNLKTIHSGTIWRVNTTSLSYGSVWVNGHNLGRYPEKIKIGGHYIPGCWLKQGNNLLVIYDEYGIRPDKVMIEAEARASRDTRSLKFQSKILQ